MGHWIQCLSANVPSSFRSSSAGGSEDEQGDAGSRHVFLYSAEVHVLSPMCIWVAVAGQGCTKREKALWSCLLALSFTVCES